MNTNTTTVEFVLGDANIGDVVRYTDRIDQCTEDFVVLDVTMAGFDILHLTNHSILRNMALESTAWTFITKQPD